MIAFVRDSSLGLALLLWAAASVGWAAEEQQLRGSADVIALTDRLSVAIDELLADPGLRAEQTTAYQQRKHEAAIATLKQVRPRVAELRKRVAASSDPEASRPYFERGADLRGEIASYAEESWLPDATREKARHVRALFDRLAKYYQ
jgi:hypothetical protein